MIRRVLLLSGSVLLSSFGLVGAAHAATIQVTTFQDENGENPNACSLREAIQASATKLAFGGCPAGQRYYTDTIQLDAGTYPLSSELVVSGEMKILGASTIDPISVDPITGVEPKRLPITTTLIAANGQRIFNTSSSQSSLSLSNMILSGGTADLGGAIRAGGIVTLNRVHIDGATATQQGGAIYIEGTLATLNATASSFTHNNAPQGAVLGMSCFDNVLPTVRSFTLTQNSVTGNGSSNSVSILDFCGQPDTTITASTIAQNTTSFASDSAVIRVIGDINTRLGRLSKISLVSDTLTENNTPAALGYSLSNSLSIINSIVAFNSDSGLDCKYMGNTDPATGNPPIGTSASFNLFSTTSTPGTSATSKCQLYPASSDTDSNVYASSSDLRSDFVNPLGLYGNSDLLGYLPKATATKVINNGAATSSCGGADQRGLVRSSGTPFDSSNTFQVINCDIGALELSLLTANEDQNGLNVSYDTVIHTQTNTTGLTPAQADILNAQNTAYLAEYKRTYRYREAIMNVVANDNAQEIVTNNASIINLLTNPDKYAITGSDNGNIHCEWNPVMKQMLASRNDGTTTVGGDKDSCTYTIKSLVDGTTKTAKMEFTISNIAPIAKNDALTLPFGAKSIPLNLLANDSDDGDGPVGSKNYPVGKTPFYEYKVLIDPNKPATPDNIRVIPINIRIVTKPTQGHIVAQYTQDCPDNNVNKAATVCYGGNLTYVNDNLFSPFNDSFTYQVIDSDLTASNPATVTITNTATTTDQKKAGAGSLGLSGLLGLLSLVFMRRRMVS